MEHGAEFLQTMKGEMFQFFVEFLENIEVLLFTALSVAVETRFSSSALASVPNIVITIIDIHKFQLDISSLDLVGTSSQMQFLFLICPY